MPIGIDLDKAKEIHKDHIRNVRNPLLQAKDVEYMRAQEAGDTENSHKHIFDHIQILAKVDSDSAPSVLTLSTLWVNANTAGPGTPEVITGGVAGVGPTTTVNYIAPETTTTGFSNVWGAITISATTVQT